MRVSKAQWPVLIIFLTYLLATVPLLKVPLRWDETEWSPQATAILKRAVPEVLFYESPFIYHPQAWLMRYGADYGLWHPPLYLYCLAVFMGFLGENIMVVRFFGLFCALATLGVVVFGVWHIAREKGWSNSLANRAAFISGMIVAVNPFYVHGALLPDIDNTVLMFLTILYLFLFVFSKEFPTGRRLFLLGLISLLLFWSKLTTPVLMILTVAFYCILKRQWNLLFKMLWVTTFSAVVFVLSWLIYAWIFKLPASFFLDFTYLGKASHFLQLNLFNILSAARFNIVMISFPLVALAVLFFIPRVISWIKAGFFLEAEDLFWLMAAVLFFFYSFLWNNFGKYTVMMVPILAVPIGLNMVKLLNHADGKSSIWFWMGIGLAALLYYWWIVPDIIVGPHRISPVTGFTAAMTDPRILKYFLAAIPVFLAFCIPCLRKGRPVDFKITRAIAMSLLVILFPANIAQNITMFPVCLESSILTPYKATGFMDTVRFTNEILLSSDKVLAPKEFACYLKRGKVIPIDREIAYPAKFLPTIFQENSLLPEYAIFCVQPHWLLDLSGFYDRYKMIRRIGNFSVWKRSK